MKITKIIIASVIALGIQPVWAAQLPENLGVEAGVSLYRTWHRGELCI